MRFAYVGLALTVGDDATGSHKIDQPVENLLRSIGDLEERKAREDHSDSQAEDWHTRHWTLLDSVLEDAGSTAFQRHTVQRTRRTVGVSVSGTEDGGDEESVDEVLQSVDAEVVHGDDIGRGSSGTAT